MEKNLLGFGVGENVRLEVGGLGEFLVAAVEWANVRPVARVNSDVRSVKVSDKC